ncbi:hypothetical protein TREMEDRAFT_30662 [Tremella mesenterica DSM 1558]|uniref:uncharacterized protein n=1 Tax=Tremella mesenterica (strain ATCC 24925 / CBS 8224 / DSM 1558 / NBRC 9311 / NRRL Y-6157 / RJB 2259-6 / UBC 559-6) TaxID=578456 RepID=UPI0003F491C0|nr:uncharacterized protein TREMEDRAFT_30662 [Tremella mesenterica DSM 1558]EIW69642.1 hypothetical protein TREMEDRAFT_30662 [Tremella mesenterica DSM 1558]
MHPLNRYRHPPDFSSLAKSYPPLKQYVQNTDHGSIIDFHDSASLRTLTEALLHNDWQYVISIRKDRLCPTIANRLDYLLRILELERYLPLTHPGPLRVVDIGTGHVAIYPLLLHRLRPQAKIYGTEIDSVSFEHASETLRKNEIEGSVKLMLRNEKDMILPLNEIGEVDFMICNPPFFGSMNEMEEGQAMKKSGAYGAATGAQVELITPGGEVEFVRRMIDESLQFGEKCSWYTSLIGKYSSLSPLVNHLRSQGCTNYLVQSFKPSHTVRWILAWSYTRIRLPDSLTRPRHLIGGTSFTRLLPLSTTFSHISHPPIPIYELRKRVMIVLRDIHLLEVPELSYDHTQRKSETNLLSNWEIEEIVLEPRINTWSRHARRHGVTNSTEMTEPLFRARLIFESSPRSGRTGSGLRLEWLEGRDRTIVEGLWKYILNKAQLLRSADPPQSAPQ